ncbi:MAG: ABC transporter permease [Parachlamydiales bacterium]|jgi:phospholipid/cholesterol/gamma-HCH transport system permease protein
MDGFKLFNGFIRPNAFLSVFQSLGEYTRLTIGVFWAMLKKPPPWFLIRDQLFSIGVLSLNVVAITGLSTGVVLAAQSFYQLSEKGLSGVTGIMVAKAMITELGPVLTAFMLTGRVGSAMCAELGTMKVTEQIDAMRTMAVSPKWYLLAPRYLAAIFMTPLLTMFSIILGILGGWMISSFYFGMSTSSYFDPMPLHITLFDINSGMAKALFFGFLMVTICCFKGMKTKGGAAGVGQATTSSVVISYITILVSDFFLTMGLNTLHEKMMGY